MYPIDICTTSRRKVVTRVAQQGIEPTKQQRNHIMGIAENDPGLTLNELFVDGLWDGGELLESLLQVALLKVIRVFRFAEVEREGKNREKEGEKVKTDHFIPVADDHLHGIVLYVVQNMKGASTFVQPADLPLEYQELAQDWVDTVRAKARWMLIHAAVVRLLRRRERWVVVNGTANHLELPCRGAMLWYHDTPSGGIWQASQRLVDAYPPLSRHLRDKQPRRKRDTYRDDRHYHGRPSRDRGRVVAGVSIGGR